MLLIGRPPTIPKCWIAAAGPSGWDRSPATDRAAAAAAGRAPSPDEPFADQLAANPQSWNLYSYTRNNPLSLVDPSGRCVMPAEAPQGTAPNAICRDVYGIEGISERGIRFIKEHEGLRREVYERTYTDPKTGEEVKDRRTVGYGHVVKAGDKIVGGKIDDTQAEQFLKQDLKIAERIVRKMVDELQLSQLSQYEFDALVDLAFNLGGPNLNAANSPRLRKAIRNGDYDEMSNQLKYTKIKGVVAPGLVTRSADRRALFREGMGIVPQ